MTQIDIEKALKKGHNRERTRQYRNKKINDFLFINLLNKKYVYFFTFTFNDENLPINQLNFKRYLQKNHLSYVLFYDEGGLNERPHYHGFVALDYILNGDVFNKFGFTKYREILSTGTRECLTAQFYLSQKNFNERIKRLMIHYDYEIPKHTFTLEEIRDKMKVEKNGKSLYCLNLEEELLKMFQF